MTQSYSQCVWDWTSFWTGFASSVAGGLLVLIAAYFLVENRLHLRDARDRRIEHDLERENIRRSVLQAVLSELQSAAAYLPTWLRELPGGKGIPTPGFDANGWPLVSQVSAITTLDPKTIENLSHSYNRMRSANDQLAYLIDITVGPTAITVAHLRAGLDEEMAKKAHAAHEAWQEDVRNMLIERCNDLKGFLDKAIDSVEAELGIHESAPSAQRVHVPEET
jgi:hypothetical protein